MQAAKHDHGPRENGEGPSGFIIRELKLDERQQQDFARLRDEHRNAINEEEREDHRLHDLYFAALKSDTVDANKTDSIATLIGEQRKKMASATFDHFQRLRALCNADQKKLFDKVIDEIARRIAGPPPGEGPPPPRQN
jgi:Spy/CpxP family protein refolding chaperone